MMRILMFLLSLSFGNAFQNSSTTQEVCNLDEVQIKCANNSVIYIDRARYGRMTVGKCLQTEEYGHFNCSSDVRLYLDSLCSGRRSCTVRQNSVLAKSPHGCPNQLIASLEISHHCLQVETPDIRRAECQNRYSVIPTFSSGYLAKVTTEELNIGSSSCPWSIEAKSGQTINLTLIDFSVWTKMDNEQSRESTCKKYGQVMERSSPRYVIICGGLKRQQHIHTSISNSLQVTLNNDNNDYYLIRYDVIGCSDPVSPPHTVIERNGADIIARCDTGDKEVDKKLTWTFRCQKGDRWSNVLDVNCSEERDTVLAKDKSRNRPEHQVDNGVIIVVGIGVAVIVSVIILTTGLFCLCKSRILRRPQMDVPMSDWTTYSVTSTPGGEIGGDSDLQYCYRLVPSDTCRSLDDDGRMERDYATTLQMRLNALPLPTAAVAAAPFSHAIDPSYGDGRTVVVYCPYHGTLSRVGETRSLRKNHEHKFEEPAFLEQEVRSSDQNQPWNTDLYQELDVDQVATPTCAPEK